MQPKIHKVDGRANAVLKKNKEQNPKNPLSFYYYINKDCGTSAWDLAKDRFSCRTNTNTNMALYLV